MKNRIIKIFASFVVSLSSLASAGQANAQAEDRPHAQAFVVKSTPTVTVHTIVAPASAFAVTSHIIEFKTQLFIVDGQLLAPFAADLKAYVDKLGKPVTRFYISHEHPDHYLGMGEAFPDVTVYALPGVRRDIAIDGPKQVAKWTGFLGPKMVAQRLNLPTLDAKPGEEKIDGVKVEFASVDDNESPEALVVKLPEIGVYIAQDLIYNGVHLFAAGPTDGWRKALKGILAEKNFTTFLAGHGRPADRLIIEQNLAYLDTVDRIRREATNAADYKRELLKVYPDLLGAQLVDIYSPLIYPVVK